MFWLLTVRKCVSGVVEMLWSDDCLTRRPFSSLEFHASIFFSPDLFLLGQLNRTQVWAQMELLHSIWNEEWVEMEVNAKANAVWKHMCSVPQFDFSSLLWCLYCFSLNELNFLFKVIFSSKLSFTPGFTTAIISSPVSVRLSSPVLHYVIEPAFIDSGN